MKIIIVDDEMSALHVFLSDVIGTNIDYKFFKDSEDEIVDYVLKNKINAAFLDVCMPNIDGISLAKKLVSICKEIKIVFITGLNVSEKDLDDDLRKFTIGFLYKPYRGDELSYFLSLIESGERILTVKMFGTFDCFIDERIIKFSSSKSKELFALLLTYNGKTLTMTDAISQLWSDLDTDKSKALYRDAVWRLRKTLNDINFRCIEFQRAQLFLDKTNIVCDYWNYLNGDKTGYNGEFLKSYDWSVDYLALLDKNLN